MFLLKDVLKRKVYRTAKTPLRLPAFHSPAAPLGASDARFIHPEIVRHFVPDRLLHQLLEMRRIPR